MGYICINSAQAWAQSLGPVLTLTLYIQTNTNKPQASFQIFLCICLIFSFLRFCTASPVVTGVVPLCLTAALCQTILQAPSAASVSCCKGTGGGKCHASHIRYKSCYLCDLLVYIFHIFPYFRFTTYSCYKPRVLVHTSSLPKPEHPKAQWVFTKHFLKNDSVWETLSQNPHKSL